MDVHLQTEKQAVDLFQDGWMLSDLLKHLSRELRRRQAYLDPIDLASRYEELEYGFCYTAIICIWYASATRPIDDTYRVRR